MLKEFKVQYAKDAVTASRNLFAKHFMQLFNCLLVEGENIEHEDMSMPTDSKIEIMVEDFAEELLIPERKVVIKMIEWNKSLGENYYKNGFSTFAKVIVSTDNDKHRFLIKSSI